MLRRLQLYLQPSPASPAHAAFPETGRPIESASSPANGLISVILFLSASDLLVAAGE